MSGGIKLVNAILGV